jgi:prevent-host-death family protein
MIEVSQSKLRDNLAQIVRAAMRGEPVMVKRRGKEVVVILPAADWHILQALETKLDLEYLKEHKAELDDERSAILSRAKAPTESSK